MIRLIFMLNQLFHAALGYIAFPEDPWRFVPKDSTVAIVVQEPQRIVDFVFSYLDQLEADDRFTEVLCGEPHPLLERSDVAELFAEVTAYRQIAKHIDSITLVVAEVSPKTRYGIRVRFSDTSNLDDFGDFQLGDRLAAFFLNIANDINGNEVSDDPIKSTNPVSDARILDPERWTYLKQEKGWQQLLQQIVVPLKLHYIEFSERSLIVSNDEALFALMSSISNDPDLHSNRTILSDRRFRRAHKHLQAGQTPVATAYCRPIDILPWFESDYTPEYLENRGYPQLVGAWCELYLGTHWSSTVEPPVRLKISVPHTVPPEAMIKSWHAA